MASFIGRKAELSSLEELYGKSGFQMTVLYGRRRVGKSTLLTQFVKGKRAVFYTAIRSSAQRNLELMSRRVLEVLAPEAPLNTFSSFEALFTYVGQQAREKRLAFIIDEFPYLAEADPTILSVLQKHIDTEWLPGQLYLILSGSSVSFMEDQVLSEKSPLFGRRTSQIELLPFHYWEAAEFVPSWTAEDKAVCYGVTGGIAKYLSLFDEKLTLDENLERLFFSKSGYLFEEPSNILTQEFRNVSTYSAIIEAAASGKNTVKELADAAHLEGSTVSHALDNLISTGIMKRVLPITEEHNRRKAQYVLADHMFQFWYRFVPLGLDLVELSRGAEYYEAMVKPRISEYMGSVFEDMCRTYTLARGIGGLLGCHVVRVGKWWGTNPAKRQETDIDVVGLDPMSHQALLGECKYKNEPVGQGVLETLKERNGLISHAYITAGYLLFSKSGFTDWILNHAAEEKVLPITLEDMYENVK